MDALAQFDAIVPVFQSLARRTEASHLDTPTPCEEWKVRDLLDHLIGGAGMFAPLIRGEAPPSEAPVVPDDAMPEAAAAAVADVDDAFRSPGALERIVATPFGDMPGDTFARLLAFDVLMHSWDLATATGQTVEISEAVVGEVDAFARAAIQPEMRGPGTFGPELVAAEGASGLERLVAFSGRSR